MNGTEGNYRERIYGTYASSPVTPVAQSEEEAESSWIRAHEYYLRDWLPTGEAARCIDLGCGAGAFLALLRKRGLRHAEGVDLSEEQVTIVRGRGLSATRGNLLDALAKHDGDLDLVTAFDVIEHLRKDELFALLAATIRALAPGGALILQCPNAASPMGMTVRYGDFTHETGLTPVSLGHLLRLHHFDQVEFREAGPVPNGIASALRKAGWMAIRALLTAWDYVETGAPGAPVKTRVMFARAIKPDSMPP